ncbi:hypothetical protein NDU88_002253 [Pleurodeles waltl]|uniref:Uncharacterized protein n=1 Tax=Pleurodeles waltl TaxID=8319 RepID=A0AAV7SB33_PLEWA|nr:hypothetical protein NDU88_002253 [Pleurodeles waltl]
MVPRRNCDLETQKCGVYRGKEPRKKRTSVGRAERLNVKQKTRRSVLKDPVLQAEVPCIFWERRGTRTGVFKPTTRNNRYEASYRGGARAGKLSPRGLLDRAHRVDERRRMT